MKDLATVVAVMAALTAGPVFAEETLLTVSGAVDGGEPVLFDRAGLEALPETVFTTSTIWTEGEQAFTGVLLSDLLEEVGATGSALKATALNDYSVEIPATDAVDGGPIVAYLMDGEPMSVRDKGPLWIVYPYDNSADYRTETIYSRSIWQLDRIEVID